MAAHLSHGFRCGIEIRADEIAPLLRVKLRENAGRADQIAEHHRDVTALASDVGGPCTDLYWRGIGGDASAFWLSRGSLRRWRNSIGKPPDCTQHFQPVPERQLEVFKMLIGQVGKNREIDAVFGKTLGVFGHAELFEPVGNLLHCEPLRTERWSGSKAVRF